MANAVGQSILHLKSSGKPRRLVLKGDDNAFSATTTLQSAVDTHQGQWEAKKIEVIGDKKQILVLTLQCVKEPKVRLKDTSPDPGMLTITLTNGPQVTPVPVVYVNDDNP